MNGLTRLDLCAAMFALQHDLEIDEQQYPAGTAELTLTAVECVMRDLRLTAKRARVQRFAAAHAAAVESESGARKVGEGFR